MGDYYNYDGDHGASFWKCVYEGNRWQLSNNTPKHSWTDFKLIPLKRLEVEPAQAGYAMVSLAGTSLRMDITDYLPGGKTFGNRAGSWQFAVPPDAGFSNWAEIHSLLRGYFDGSRFVVRLDDEDGIYYKGRLTFSTYTPGNYYSTAVINYDLDASESDTLGA